MAVRPSKHRLPTRRRCICGRLRFILSGEAASGGDAAEAVARGTSRGLRGTGSRSVDVRELRISMTGTFTVVDAPGAARAGLLRKAQDLLALILLAPRRSVLREHAAEALWPDAGPEASKKAMRQALWQV